MKKITYFAGVMLLFASCSSNESSQKPQGVTTSFNLENPLPDKPQTPQAAVTTEHSLAFSHGDFDRLVAFINAHGTKVTVRGVQSDTQYIFWDSQKNRHALIAIRRTDGRPDPSGACTQISVWVNSKDVPKDKKSFYYFIRPDKVIVDNVQDQAKIQNGLEELLKKV